MTTTSPSPHDPAPTAMIAVLDSTSHAFVRLVTEPHGTTHELALAQATAFAGAADGTVFTVPLRHGVPMWNRATADLEETTRRRAEAAARLARLGAHDDGGDLALG